MALRTVGVRLTADVNAYLANMKRAGVATKDFVGQMDEASKAGKLDAVADRAGMAGLALGAMAGYAIKAAADFDKSMSAVKAATHAGAAEMGQLREAALQAGKSTAYSATEAAGAITELSKAGVSTADVLGGGLKGALSLAAAGQLDVGEAAETAASAMTQFKLSGKDIPHIADLLAAGAGKAQGSVHDMGAALNQSGLVASQFGLSIEDTTGTLAAFASAGLTGSDAGTSFKQMLLMLANPAGKTKDLMEDLGIAAYDASGKFVGITNLAEQLKTKLSGLTQAQRDAALAQIFGSDAIRSANVLYQQGGKGLDEWIKKVNDQGYAAKTAGDLTDNLAGDIEKLKGSLETLAIESGSGANGGLRELVKGLNSMVDQFDRMPDAVTNSLVVVAGIGGVLGLALAAFIKLRRGVASAVEELTAMGPAGERAATGLSAASAAAAKAAALLAALEIVGAIADRFGAASTNVDKLTDSLTNFSNTGKVAGELSDVFGDDLSDLGRNASAADAATHGFWKGLNDLTTAIPGVHQAADSLNESIYGLSFNQAKDNMAALDQALTAYMTTTNDATKSSEVWNRVASEAGIPIDHLIQLLPNAYKKVGELNMAQMEARKSGNAMAEGTKNAAAGADAVAGATGPAAEETKKYTTAADAAAAAARGQRDALGQLATFMKSETDPVFGLIDAESKLKKAQDAASEAIKKHGKNSTEAKAATRELALAAINLQEKAGLVSGTFDGKMTPALYKTLRAAGLSKAEIKILEQQFKDAKKAADQYDGNYVAKASAPGAVDAKTKMADAWAQAKGFEGQYNAKLTVTGDKQVDAKLADLLIKQRALATGLSYPAARAAVQKDLDRNRQRKATGGPVFGPGSRTSDSIPAYLSNDEHVWTADEVDALGGHGRMIQLRRAVKSGKRVEFGDETPGFALGGKVTWPFRTNVEDTKIPTPFYSVPGGGGGPGYKWMEAAIRAAFPGLGVISDFRPGAVTLTGNRSYHAVGRAVDYPPSKPLAEWINLHYMGATRELITPWNSLNIHNGRRHAYTGAVWNQHNFAGGNAHDHWAMRNGGTITEPIFGVGASGRTYSFGENYQRETVIPNWHGGGGGTVTVVLENHGVIGSRAEVNDWLTGAVDDLRRKGRI